MIYVKQEITDFTYSNIVSTVDEYSPTTNYLLGDFVRVGSYHYKSLYGTVSIPNVGNDPLSSLGTAWFEYEPSNIYACLDPFEETRTTWTADGIIEFKRGSKNTLGIGAFTASQVTIEYKDAFGVTIDTDNYYYSSNAFVFDEWSYGYGNFNSSNNRVIYLPLKLKGVNIRVTFSKSGLPTDCGFFIAGRAVDMGSTLENVSFPDKRIGSKTVKVADFNTSVKSTEIMQKISDAKLLVDEPMLFVIDNNKNSLHQNMVILGTIKQCSGNASNNDRNLITWQLEQTILI